jgi:hypothetical protein
VAKSHLQNGHGVGWRVVAIFGNNQSELLEKQTTVLTCFLKTLHASSGA